MEEVIVLSMLLCVGLEAMALYSRVWPLAFVSSLGWTIIALDIFNESESWLALGLIVMIAFAQVIIVKEAERW